MDDCAECKSQFENQHDRRDAAARPIASPRSAFGSAAAAPPPPPRPPPSARCRCARRVRAFTLLGQCWVPCTDARLLRQWPPLHQRPPTAPSPTGGFEVCGRHRIIPRGWPLPRQLCQPPPRPLRRRGQEAAASQPRVPPRVASALRRLSLLPRRQQTPHACARGSGSNRGAGAGGVRLRID